MGLLVDTFHVNIEESSWTEPFRQADPGRKALPRPPGRQQPSASRAGLDRFQSHPFHPGRIRLHRLAFGRVVGQAQSGHGRAADHRSYVPPDERPWVRTYAAGAGMKLSCLPVSFFDDITSGKMSVAEWAQHGRRAQAGRHRPEHPVPAGAHHPGCRNHPVPGGSRRNPASPC